MTRAYESWRAIRPPEGLHFRSLQDDPALDSVQNVVVMAGAPIGRHRPARIRPSGCPLPVAEDLPDDLVFAAITQRR